MSRSTDTEENYATIDNVIRTARITIDTQFIPKRPQSAWKSHDYKRHWRYTLYQDVGESSWVEIASGDYTEGSGYCKQPKGIKSGEWQHFQNIKQECSTGITCTGGIVKSPKPADILWSLCQDASCVMNCETFADFCRDLGYDYDSRDAMRVFKACQNTYTDLRATIGLAGIEKVLESGL